MALYKLNPVNSLLKAGFIGLGPHAIENLIPSIQTSDKFVLNALSSRNIERANDFAGKFNCPYITDRWQDLVEGNEVDVVFVSGPPELHEEVLWSCLENMKPVFVEKPPARNLDVLNELVYQYESKSLKSFVGYNFRFADALLQLQPQSTEISSLQINMHSNKPERTMWNCGSVFESYLYAVGIHAIEYATHLFGKLKDLDFYLQSLNHNKFILNLSLSFENGKHAQLCLSNCKLKFEISTELFNIDGRSVTVTNLRSQTWQSMQNNQKVVSTTEPSGLKGGYTLSGYRNELDCFAKELCGDGDVLSPLSGTVPVYEIINELIKYSKKD